MLPHVSFLAPPCSRGPRRSAANKSPGVFFNRSPAETRGGGNDNSSLRRPSLGYPLQQAPMKAYAHKVLGCGAQRCPSPTLQLRASQPLKSGYPRFACIPSPNGATRNIPRSVTCDRRLVESGAIQLAPWSSTADIGNRSPCHGRRCPEIQLPKHCSSKRRITKNVGAALASEPFPLSAPNPYESAAPRPSRSHRGRRKRVALESYFPPQFLRC